MRRALLHIAMAPFAASIAVGALLSYGIWCAADFVLPKKDNNA